MKRLIASIKQSWLPLSVGALLICTYLIWSFFYCLYIGCIIICYTLFYIVSNCREPSKEGEDGTIALGCFLALFLFIVAVYWNKKRYISDNSSCQHMYIDCPRMNKASNIVEVYELEGFFHLRFLDCEECEERKIEERERRQEEKEAQRRQKLAEYLQHQIDRLNEGTDADVVLEDLRNRFADEDETDYIPGVPSRYQ